jgi:hypothetical protein
MIGSILVFLCMGVAFIFILLKNEFTFDMKTEWITWLIGLSVILALIFY